MAAGNRSNVLTKLPKVLKKHYKPYPVNTDRPVLEHLLFAACLEDAPYEAAEEAFANLTETYFDWNEVRVTTIAELAESMQVLPDPHSAAARLRHTLQSVFESQYSFDLDAMKKMNLGQAVKKVESFDGSTPFMVSYLTQAALGGHSIPIDRGLMGVFEVLGVVTPKDVSNNNVPGLERAVPKSKGLEIGTLLHQLGADFIKNPYSPSLHKILLELEPEAKDRLPKRQRKKAAAAADEETNGEAAPAAKPRKKSSKAKKAAAKKGTAKTSKKSGTKKTSKAKTSKKKSATKTIARRKPR